jgi:hypothetical protein
VTTPSELLDRDDIALVRACLLASDEDPFFPDWEFQALFGIERSQLGDVRRRWPNVSLTEEAVYLSVINAIANLEHIRMAMSRPRFDMYPRDARGFCRWRQAQGSEALAKRKASWGSNEMVALHAFVRGRN